MKPTKISVVSSSLTPKEDEYVYVKDMPVGTIFKQSDGLNGVFMRLPDVEGKDYYYRVLNLKTFTLDSFSSPQAKFAKEHIGKEVSITVKY